MGRLTGLDRIRHGTEIGTRLRSGDGYSIKQARLGIGSEHSFISRKEGTGGNIHDSVAFHPLYDRIKEKRGMGYAQYRALAQTGK